MNKYILISIILSILFTACSKNEPIYTTKLYKNVSNNDILNAAKKVLKLSDEDYKIHSFSDHIEAKKLIVKKELYDAQIKINSINLSTTVDKDIVIAKLKIEQKKDFFDESVIITQPAVHKLLWGRINYILGLNKNWPTCFEYNLKLNYDGIICNKLYYNSKSVSPSDIIIHKYIPKEDKNSEENILEDIDLEGLENIQLPNADVFDNNQSN